MTKAEKTRMVARMHFVEAAIERFRDWHDTARSAMQKAGVSRDYRDGFSFDCGSVRASWEQPWRFHPSNRGAK